MKGPDFNNFKRDFQAYKREVGVGSDPGGALEGLWSMELDSTIKKFERDYPGIDKEFDKLIALLPDPNSFSKTEFPFAASVLRMNVDGKLEVLSRSVNMVNARTDSTQHAEMVAIQEAQQFIGDKHLKNCIILSTAQPCEMCSGAIRNTNIDTLVYSISQQELKGKHVKFSEDYKPIRTTPEGIDVDTSLLASGVKVFGGYKHDEVLHRLSRFVGTFKEYYEDPDA